MAGQVSWDEDPIARDEDPIASIQAAAHLSEGQLVACCYCVTQRG